jgi:hypothetical protein
MSSFATEASADRFRIGGRAHVRIGGGSTFRVHTPRVYWRPRYTYARPAYRVHIGGSIWVGGGYYYPRYASPPPATYCDCGPSTVPAYYHPVQPAPATYATYAEPAPQLPRWGLGVFAGGVNVEGEPEGSDLGLIARLRLTPGLLIEGEIAKTELEDGMRVDRRLGAGLVWEIAKYNKLTPYLVGSVGVTQVDVDNQWESSQSYGELGVGLRYAITPRFHIIGDIRAGSREMIDGDDRNDDPSLSSGGGGNLTTRALVPTDDEGEEFSRARIGLLAYF